MNIENQLCNNTQQNHFQTEFQKNQYEINLATRQSTHFSNKDELQQNKNFVKFKSRAKIFEHSRNKIDNCEPKNPSSLFAGFNFKTAKSDSVSNDKDKKQIFLPKQNKISTYKSQQISRKSKNKKRNTIFGNRNEQKYLNHCNTDEKKLKVIQTEGIKHYVMERKIKPNIQKTANSKQQSFIRQLQAFSRLSEKNIYPAQQLKKKIQTKNKYNTIQEVSSNIFGKYITQSQTKNQRSPIIKFTYNQTKMEQENQHFNPINQKIKRSQKRYQDNQSISNKNYSAFQANKNDNVIFCKHSIVEDNNIAYQKSNFAINPIQNVNISSKISLHKLKESHIFNQKNEQNDVRIITSCQIQSDLQNSFRYFDESQVQQTQKKLSYKNIEVQHQEQIQQNIIGKQKPWRHNLFVDFQQSKMDSSKFRFQKQPNNVNQSKKIQNQRYILPEAYTVKQKQNEQRRQFCYNSYVVPTILIIFAFCLLIIQITN